MADVGKKVKMALDEARLLILGGQVLLGFQFRSFFEGQFDSLPTYAQNLKLAGALLMVVAIILLILPATYHRIVEQGEATMAQHNFTSDVMDFALLPFALVLGLDTFLAFDIVVPLAGAIAAGAAVTGTALTLWYVYEWILRTRLGTGGNGMKAGGDDGGRTPLHQKLEHVMTECRVVLPGVQALLGFQFATMLMEAFNDLPVSSKYVHLGCLLLMALAMILLMMPAAYHRMVEMGEDTERLHRFASKALLLALIPLSLGVSGDVFVITRKVTESIPLALAVGGGTVALCFTCWFGIMFWIRGGRKDRALKEAAAAI